MQEKKEAQLPQASTASRSHFDLPHASLKSHLAIYTSKKLLRVPKELLTT